MNKALLAISALALGIGVLVATAPSTYAYRGDPNAQGPNYSSERHEKMEKAFENKDYNAWKTLMQGRGRITQKITEQNFARFAEAHELAEQGKTQEANKIRQELGLGAHKDGGQGQKNGMGRGCNK